MAAAFYVPPSQSEWTRLATGPEVRSALEDVATKGRAVAESLAATFTETGDYASSFDVRMTVGPFAGHQRAIALLGNASDHAAQVELRHHVLARTRDWMAVS